MPCFSPCREVEKTGTAGIAIAPTSRRRLGDVTHHQRPAFLNSPRQSIALAANS